VSIDKVVQTFLFEQFFIAIDRSTGKPMSLTNNTYQSTPLRTDFLAIHVDRHTDKTMLFRNTYPSASLQAFYNDPVIDLHNYMLIAWRYRFLIDGDTKA